jgi:hypothetical protein
MTSPPPSAGDGAQRGPVRARRRSGPSVRTLGEADTRTVPTTAAAGGMWKAPENGLPASGRPIVGTLRHRMADPHLGGLREQGPLSGLRHPRSPSARGKFGDLSQRLRLSRWVSLAIGHKRAGSLLAG